MARNENTILKRKIPGGYQIISSKVPFRFPIEVEGLISQSKTVTPDAHGFTVRPDAGFDVLDRVTVRGDANLIPANIRKDVTIFGVTGTASGGSGGSGLYQEKYVNPAANAIQPVIADSGYDALSRVVVNSVFGTDPNFVPSNIKAGVTILGLIGTYDGDDTPFVPAGEMQKSKSVNPSVEIQYVHANDGYVGMEEVVVNSVVNIEPNITPENIKKDVTIFGITGTADTTNIYMQSKMVNPQMDTIEVHPDVGYDGLSDVIVNGISNIAPNLKPENIKTGVDILGVIGTFNGGDEPFVPPAGAVQNNKVADPRLYTYTVNPDTSYQAMRTVTVIGVAEADPNFVAGNIRKGVSILGLEGTLDYYSGNYQHKSVNPTTEVQRVFADTGFDALGSVAVNSVLNAEPNLKPENIKAGETIFNIIGTYDGGDEPRYPSGELQTKSVNPTNSIQEVTYDSGFGGLEKVIVNSVSNSDPNLIPENIRKNVTVFGITGTLETEGSGSGLYETKTVLPALTPVIAVPDNGFDALDKVVVAGLTDADPDLIPENIKAGVNIFGIVGNYTGGPEPYEPTGASIQTSKTVTPDRYTQVVYPDEGYAGLGRVIVNGLLDVEPDLKPENIKEGVEILGVVGTADFNSRRYQSKSVNPALNTFNVRADSEYDALEVVTVNGISNIAPNLIPENIKAGEEILGVTGTYTGGDTPFEPTGKTIQPNKFVNPSLEVQEVNPDKGYGSLAKVTVNSVTNVEPNLLPGNIVDGVTIFGITGTADVSSKIYQRKLVTPSVKVQSVTPDTGYDALLEVIVASITDAAPNLIPENIKAGEDILGVIGTYTGGDDPPFEPSGETIQPLKYATPGLEEVIVDPSTGYGSMKRVIVRSVLESDPNLKPENIVAGETIFGVEGIAEAGVRNPVYQTKSVNPNNTVQNISADFDYDALDRVVVNSVTNADGNLKPENIKAGVTIFDVTGTYTGGEYPFEPTGQTIETSKFVNPSAAIQHVLPSTGYGSMAEVVVGSVLDADPNLIPENVVKGVTIFGVIGEAEGGGGGGSGRYQAKSAVPQFNTFNVEPDIDYDALSKVQVVGISNVAPELKPENIKAGIEILGITGTYIGGDTPFVPSGELQPSKSVDPTPHSQVVKPDTGYVGLQKVNISGVLDIEPNINPSNIKQGVEIFGVVGEFTKGNGLYQQKSVNPRLNYVVPVEADSGFDALSLVRVNSIRNIAPELEPENIKAGVEILGITGTYTGGDDPFEPTGLTIQKSKTVNPTNEVQEVYPDDGYGSLAKVIVNSVSASEPNLRPENIVEGVEIFGITGTADIDSGNYQIKSVIPTLNGLSVEADAGYDALKRVNIASILDTNPALKPENIKAGEEILGITGTYTGGDDPFTPSGQLQPSKTAHPMTVQQTIEADTGYVGLKRVYVTSILAEEPNLIPENIKAGVEIFDIVGTAETSGAKYQIKSVIPELDPITVRADSEFDALSRVMVAGISSIAPNLKPENIKAGEEILGVVGNYTGDSSDPFIPSGYEMQLSKTVNPELYTQYVHPDQGYGSLAEVIVNSVTAAEPNLKPENIKEGVEIFGITGTANTDPYIISLHSKSVNPTTRVLQVTYDEGFDGLSMVIVNSIQNAYPELKPENIKAGVEIADIIGTYDGGDDPFIPTGQEVQPIKSVNPSGSIQYVDPDDGYVAINRVVVNSVTNADPNLRPGNIRKDVTIFGITGIMDSFNGVYQVKSVNPTNDVQTVKPDADYDALSQVIVNSLSNADPNFIPENIKAGVTILDITGTYTGDGEEPFVPDGTKVELSKTVNPSRVRQIVDPSEGYVAIKRVIVNSVLDAEPNLKPENIADGVEIFGVTGTAEIVDPSSPISSGRYQVKSVIPELYSVSVLADTGYDALSKVNVAGILDNNPELKSENIKAGVEILGITGTYTGGDDPFMPSGQLQPSKTVNPRPFEQQVTADTGYSGLVKVIVTSVLDAEPNLSPENIKDGVEIFGVTGTADLGSGNYQVKTVNPSMSINDVVADSNYDALSRVRVNSIANVAPELKPENIKAGVEILGIVGTYAGDDHPFKPNGELQHSKTVNPTTIVQRVYPDEGYAGLEMTIVNSVLDVEPLLVPENIKKGVTIFGVDGIVEPSTGDSSKDNLSLQTKSANPTTSIQQIMADPSYDALSAVIINSMTDAYPNLKPENIKAGVEIADIIGTYTGGDDPFEPTGITVQLSKSVNPSNEIQYVNPDEGYGSIKQVIVNSVQNSDPNLRPGNIRKGVTIFGITGTVDPGSDTGLYQIKSVNPNNEVQNVIPDENFDALSKVVVNSVTNSDPNLKPENIKAGVTIFDITGTYTGDGEEPFTPDGTKVELSKTVSPKYNEKVSINPSSGYVAMKYVEVNSIQSIEPLLVPNNIRKGVTLFNGQLVGTASSSIEDIKLQQKSVVPLADQEVIVTADESYDALSSVRVASIMESEPALIPENIKDGVEILGIVGTYTGDGTEYKGNRNLYIGEHGDIIAGDLYAENTNLKPENIRRGIEIFGITGTYGGGSAPDLYEETFQLTSTSQRFTPSGHDGFSAVTITAVVDPSKIKKGEVILGVTGTYEGGSISEYDIFSNGRWFEGYNSQVTISGNMTIRPDANNIIVDYAGNSGDGFVRIDPALNVKSDYNYLQISVSTSSVNIMSIYFFMDTNPNVRSIPSNAKLINASSGTFTYQIPSSIKGNNAYLYFAMADDTTNTYHVINYIGFTSTI